MENNNNIWILVLFVVVFVGIIAYVIIAKIKRRDASWTGTVIDKNVKESVRSGNNDNQGSGISFGSRNAVNRNYSIRIKSDAGDEFNWPVGEGFYESVQVGDKLTKSPGTETPSKLSQLI